MLNSLMLSLWRPYSTPRWFSRQIYKKLLKQGKAPSFSYEKDFFGLQYLGDFDNHIDFDIFYFGAFEKPILFFMRDYLQALKQHSSEKLTFVDIGANIGQHSLFCSTLVDQVHAFEPYDKVGHRLLKQIELNQLSHITLHEVGISNNTETIPFYAPTGNNLGIGSFIEETTHKGNTCIGNLQIVNGDDYFAENNVNKIDLMKIDVEGLEKYALQGLKSTLINTRPLLLLELTYQEKDSFSSLQELEQHLPADYQLFIFNKRKTDGSKNRKKEGAQRKSGEYDIIPYTFEFPRGQDDLIACPTEKLALLNSIK